MSWRTVVISSQSKLSFKNNYLVVRGETTEMIYINEISTLIIDSTAVLLTSYLISELVKKKVKIVFCDNKRNPESEVVPYYGSHNTSKRVYDQINWNEELKTLIWTNIIKRKILNQMDLLKMIENISWKKLSSYIHELKFNDITNREGHSAKVYFNSLFGKSFKRDDDNDINAALNYGYSIILSLFNKEIVSKGFLTQLGFKHHNVYNPFNLSSDLMEPYRVIVDQYVYEHQYDIFNTDYKYALINLANTKVYIENKEQYLTNSISIYIDSIVEALETSDISKIKFYSLL